MLDELRSALELATEEELQQLTQILFCRKLNPLDYLQTPDILEVQSRDRQDWLDDIERRFRYLAADGIAVLKGQTQSLTYRDVLIRVCRYLKIPYSQQMTAIDLETEVFVRLVGRAWKRLPRSERKTLTVRVQRSLSRSNYSEPLPAQIQHNPIQILLKGSSILAVNSMLKSFLLKQIARQFAFHFATYQMAKSTLVRGGIAATAQLQNQLTIQAAKRGMAATAARHGAVRTAFAFLGPLLWATFLAELGWKAIATNYGRIIPAVFAIAQIRLIRSESWQPA